LYLQEEVMIVLLISSSAPPKNSPESVQVGRYLEFLSRNNSVTLLTTTTTGGWEPEDQTLNKYLEGVDRVIALPVIHPKIISLIKRINPMLLFPDDSVYFSRQFDRSLKEVKERPQVIISRSGTFSSALLASKLSKRWRTPWIMHLSDPWADNPYLNYNKKYFLKNQSLEKECIDQADMITLTSEKTVAFYQDKYPHHESKFRLLPNVFDDSFLNSQPVSFDEKKLRIVFTGRLYGSRNIDSLIEGISATVKLRPEIEGQVEFILAGFFDEVNIQAIKQSGLICVKYLGPISMEDSLRLQHEAAVLLVIDSLEQGALFDLFFPSKLLDYLAARRRIIALTGENSTTDKVVSGQFGSCFHADNIHQLPDHIIELVDAYLREDKQLFEVTGPIRDYSAKKNAATLQLLIDEVVKDE
jgi:glycosyltransferase involved in cell wall biosynthesis